MTGASPGRRRRRALLAALVVAAGCVALLEVGSRAAHGWTRHWLDCHRFHPQLGWSLREGWSGRSGWTGGASAINPQGIRDDHPVGPKRPGERRLLVLGDSVTFGANVRTEDAFPRRLEEALAFTGRQWRVLNGGVTAYDAAQEAEWLDLFGLVLDPDAIVVQFHPNDLLPSNRGISGSTLVFGPAARWLTENSVTVFRTQRAVLSLYARARSGRASSASAVPRVADWTPGWMAVEQAYRRIADRARERGLRVILAVYHVPDPPGGLDGREASARVARIGEGLGWPVIDLAPVLAGRSAQLLLASTHPSPAGHLVIGRYLAAEIVRRGVLP